MSDAPKTRPSRGPSPPRAVGHPEEPARVFLEALVEDLERVEPAPTWSRALLGWIAVAAPFVAVALLASGGLRPELGTIPSVSARLAAEALLGLLASISCIAAGLEWGVPGAPSRARLLALPFAATLGFVGVVAMGDALPAPAPSMAGKREHCFIESMLIAAPLYLIALAALRRRIVLAHAGAGLLVGFGAAALPGVAMQLACMYDAEHALRFHLTPALVVAVVGAVVGYAVLPRR